jgi:hypothetical protein
MRPWADSSQNRKLEPADWGLLEADSSRPASVFVGPPEDPAAVRLRQRSGDDDGFDAAKPVARILRHIEIIASLQVQPEHRRGPQRASKPQRRVRRNARLTIHQPRHPIGRDVNSALSRNGSYTPKSEKATCVPLFLTTRNGAAEPGKAVDSDGKREVSGSIPLGATILPVARGRPPTSRPVRAVLAALPAHRPARSPAMLRRSSRHISLARVRDRVRSLTAGLARLLPRCAATTIT